MSKTHIHHVIPKSRGGTNDPENLIEIDFIEHAKFHAEDFLNGGPRFDFRHPGWPYLEAFLQQAVLEKTAEHTRERNLAGKNGKGGETNSRNKTGVCGRSPEKMSEDGRLGGLVQGVIARDLKTGIHDPAYKEVCREGGRKGGRKSGKISGLKTFKEKTGIFDPMKAANNRKFMCLETGHISTPGPLSIYQKSKRINPSHRVELTPEEKAFIFLWD
jgi:general stress protein YciG